jgi:hypothetical protein
MAAIDTLMWLFGIAGILAAISVFITVILGLVLLIYKTVERIFSITKKGVLMNKLKVLIKWFSDVRRIGFAGATFNLGSNYHELDKSKAFKWYLRSAKMGYISAQSQVGTLLLLGTGVEQNVEKGKEWLLKASKQGCEHATWRLHYYYFSIKGDPVQALWWTQQAAEMNYAPAYMTLGEFHEYGLGTEANFEIAKMYYQAALSHTHEDPELRRQKKLHPIILIDYVQPTKDALERLNYNIEWGKTNGRTDSQVATAMLEYYEEQEQSQKVTQNQAQTDAAGKAIDVETHASNETKETEPKGPTIH